MFSIEEFFYRKKEISNFWIRSSHYEIWITSSIATHLLLKSECSFNGRGENWFFLSFAVSWVFVLFFVVELIENRKSFYGDITRRFRREVKTFCATNICRVRANYFVELTFRQGTWRFYAVVSFNQIVRLFTIISMAILTFDRRS